MDPQIRPRPRPRPRDALLFGKTFPSGSGGAEVVYPPIFSAPLINSLMPVTAYGSGTPTFTRITTSAYANTFDPPLTLVNANEARFSGARRVANLVVKSEDLSTSTGGWSTTGTLTSVIGAVDPIGGTAAYTLSGGAATNAWYRFVTAVAGSAFSESIWVKRIGGSGPIKLSNNGSSATTDISGSLTTSWKRFAVSGTAIASHLVEVEVTSAGDSVAIFHPQFEAANGSNTNPSEYVPVGVASAPWYGAGVDGVQNFPYQNGNTVSSNVVTEAQGAPIAAASLLGYVAEPAATNLALQSQFASGWTASFNTFTANAAVAPDGTTTAASQVENNTNNAHRVQNSSVFVVSANTTTTTSIYIKRAVGTRQVALTVFDSTLTNFFQVFFNLDTVAVGSNQSVGNGAFSSATITSLANGWFRITSTGIHSTTVANCVVSLDLASGTTIGSNVYLGNSSSGMYDWGVQLEAGSVATSYIPTTTVAVARNADALTYPASLNISGTVGSAYAEVSILGRVTSGYNPNIIGMGASSFALSLDTSSVPQVFDGTTFGGSGLSALSLNTATKVASKWGGSAMQAFEAGSAGAVQSFDGDMNVGSTISIGADTAGIRQLNGTIRNVRIYGVALTPAQLSSMTGS